MTSHRQQVHATVKALCAELGRPVSLEELRERMKAESAPVHLDAVCGSLVRTHHLRATRARNWVRERRNVYWPAGWQLVVDQAATPASRSEIVATALHAIWAEPSRGGVPISSREIRLFLKRLGTHPELLSQPTLLPTVLNALRKPGRNGTPIVASVRLPGVRAQCWLPFGADWVCPSGEEVAGTTADKIVSATRHAMELGNLLVVTHREVADIPQSGLEGPSGSWEIARQLADTSRPVQSGRGGRIARRRPHLIHLGEVAGQAYYTVPEFMRSARREYLPPAVAAFEWRRLKEDWELARFEGELALLGQPKAGLHLAAVRGSVVRERIFGFRARASELEGRTPPVALTDSARAEVRAMISDCCAVAERLAPQRMVSGSSAADARWHSTREAVAKLKGDFALDGMPSHVIHSFMSEDVVRRRNLHYQGRSGPRKQYDCRWEYEEVSLRAAAAARWGTPEVAMLARQGVHILGPIRHFGLVEAAMREGQWSPVDAAAALGMLGCERGLPLLQRISSRFPSGIAGRWVALATALISWQPSHGGNSPWRQVLR